MEDSNIVDLLEKCDIYTTTVPDTERYLHRLLMFRNEKPIDILKAMISVMRRYQNEKEVQLRSVHNLATVLGDYKIEDVDLDTLKEIVGLLVIIIELYSDNDRIVQCALWILCQKRFLNNVAFDVCRCFNAVMNYFAISYDPEIQKLALRVFYILPWSMTDQPLTFNFPPQCQAKMLSMIRPHAKSKPIDERTLMALGALTSLTSGNLTVCDILVEEGDMEIFIEMLDTFHGEKFVEISLLRILYNVLEAGLFKQQLIQRPLFISKLCQLFNSEHISVSYCAAGVMAYLLVDMPTRLELVDQLHCVIKKWPTDAKVMFRSLKPLYSLLQCSDVYSVQLYAAWCIRQICAYKFVYYCKRFERDNGLEIVKRLEEDETTHPDVRNLCSNICDIYLANRLNNTSIK